MAIRLSMPWFGKADSAAGRYFWSPSTSIQGDPVCLGGELIWRALHEEAFLPENG